jgi:hypothetical protein
MQKFLENCLVLYLCPIKSCRPIFFSLMILNIFIRNAECICFLIYLHQTDEQKKKQDDQKHAINIYNNAVSEHIKTVCLIDKAKKKMSNNVFSNKSILTILNNKGFTIH